MSEFTSEIKTDSSYINGNTFNLKKVKYSIINGLAIFEGDIILGTVDEMNKNKRLADVQKVVAISGADYRWPQLLIPFSIEDGFPNAVRITNAINHWQTNTPAMFIERTSANASSHPNYILFKKGTNCSSKVGMQGGPGTHFSLTVVVWVLLFMKLDMRWDYGMNRVEKIEMHL